ncbi:MAG TPA: metallophosphoesterase [bacterium]|nr:metallophosphoesterase [bacterium]
MTVPPQAAADPRPILFVGDIQGCVRELDALLARAGFRPGEHRLLPVGDTINRGPDAVGVLERLRACGAEPILGNHERGLLEIWRTGHAPAWAHGEHSAYVQLVRAGRWEAAMAEIAGWPLVREGPDWIAVHAGLHPHLPPQATGADFLTEVRWCDAQGRRPEGASKAHLDPPPGYRPWYAFYRGTRIVVFGHWAQRGLIIEGRVRGLDTGCVYGGRLTGLWWPEARLVQVDALRTYRAVTGPVPRRME